MEFSFKTFFAHPPSTPPTPLFDLLVYIFKLKVDSSPSTYSPIHLKCVILISTHLPPTNTLSKYLPNPIYMARPTYMVATPIKPQQFGNDEERIK
jgi:hypothetical protein